MHIDMQIICKKCGTTREYVGSKHRTSCSNCHSSITISESAVTEPPTSVPKQSIVINHEVKFTKTLWRDARLSQRMMGLENMGEKWLVLKVDDNGFLSL